MINLWETRETCCGCAACQNICPKNAITMVEDGYGNIFPKIDTHLCVDCHMCEKVCNYKSGNTMFNSSLQVYAAYARDWNILKNAASGGVFGVFAKAFIGYGGVVYGVELRKSIHGLRPEHIRITSESQISALQGSKYAQSLIGDTYKQIKKDLSLGKKVLFSGTPCQVDGLTGYLGKEKYLNLLTVDIICHGVPNARILSEYIKNIEERDNIKIFELKFRDKINGWGYNGSYIYMSRDGKRETALLNSAESSYYQLFLGCDIHRDNCYLCKYARKERCSDITIGDYWGIEEVHPELLMENGGMLDVNKGVSCILVNTDNGKRWFDEVLRKEIILFPSTIDKVRKTNCQLNHPSEMGKYHDKVLRLFKNKGYTGIEKFWQRKQKINGIRKQVKVRINLLLREKNESD